MTESQNNQPLELRELEISLDQLIAQYAAAKQENQSLKVRQDELLLEKAKLLAKTNLARTRINDMIARLKTMEHGS
jgi:cell division protein ZapB